MIELKCPMGTTLIKLDMENTFDRVRISFLYKVIRSFGFSSTFVNLIKACTYKPQIAPIINGRPTHFFQAIRGLWQGFLLSSSLYNLMVESLSRKLSIEKKQGLFRALSLQEG